MYQRRERVAEEIRKELAGLIGNEVKDPRIGMVSITRVELTSDLRYARVFVSVLGSEEDQKSSLAGLNSALGYLRREVGHRLGLRFAPELAFKQDSSIEYGVRMSELIDRVQAGKEERE